MKMFKIDISWFSQWTPMHLPLRFCQQHFKNCFLTGDYHIGFEQWELYSYNKIHLNNIYGLYIMLSLNYKALGFTIYSILKGGLCTGKHNVFISIIIKFSIIK